MQKATISIFIILTSCVIYTKAQNAQWIDPHEMSLGNMNIIKSDKQSETKAPEHPSQVTFSLEHYKRLLTFILNNAAFDDKSSTYKGQINLNIPISDHKFITHFIRDGYNEDAAVLRKIDQVMSRILSRSKFEDFSLFLMSWTDYIYFMFYNRTTGIILSCVFLLIISYKLLRSNFTIWSVVKYLIFIGWVFDFAFTWIQLLQKAEIDRLADIMKYKAVPLHCDPGKMSFWQYLWFSVSSSDECRQYHHTVYSDIFWAVAPLQVLSHQLGIVIYTPASHIGKAMGLFSSGILSTLPWGVNVVLLPALLIFTLLIVGILLSFTTETSFQINIFHLFNFAFGNRERAAVGDVLTGRNLTALLDVVHRNMIEDVRPNASQTSNTENCACSQETIHEGEVKSIEKNINSNIPEKVSDEMHDESGDH